MKAFTALALLSLVMPAMLFAQKDETAAAAASNEFAVTVLESLSKEPGNLAFSPFSAWTALTMTSGGAANQTQAEMQAVLHHSSSKGDAVHSAASKWAGRLSHLKGVELHIANRLWLAPAFSLTSEFNKVTQDHYQAGVERADFAGNQMAAIKLINDWVAGQTAGRIRNLLSPLDVPIDTKLVLTNAVYFNGQWLKPFYPKGTTNLPFTNADGKTMPTPMMLREDFVPYYEDESLQAIRLAYEGNDSSMVVVLPQKDRKAALDATTLNNVLKGLKNEKTLIRLPRFTVEQKIRMLPMLKALGMKEAFSQTADFSRMSTQEALMIGNVIHQAFVKVDEKGTEAAAATAVVMTPRGAPPRPVQTKQFIANRPFLFFIIDNATGGILFLGRVNEPEAAK